MPVGRYVRMYDKWIDTQDEEERQQLGRYLKENLRSAWETGDAATRESIIDYIRLTKEGDWDILIGALKDDDDGVAKVAMGMIALLIWEGQEFDVSVLRPAIESFEERHPDFESTCHSALARL